LRQETDAFALRSIEELEREHVQKVLAATGGSREAAARILGISRRTLTRMIQRWNLPRN
jgi:DNA-binding NtrC family response regulator